LGAPVRPTRAERNLLARAARVRKAGAGQVTAHAADFARFTLQAERRRMAVMSPLSLPSNSIDQNYDSTYNAVVSVPYGASVALGVSFTPRSKDGHPNRARARSVWRVRSSQN